MEEKLFKWLKLLGISLTVLLLALKLAILIWWIRRKIVESPAVPPPEVPIELAAQLQQENLMFRDGIELAAPASLSPPDDDAYSFA